MFDPASGETDPNNPDTDGDGILDGTEIGLTAPQRPSSTNIGIGNFIPDADPTTTTDPVAADTDSDGFSDGMEDRNKNGMFEQGETNPIVITITCDSDLDLDWDVDALDLSILVQSMRTPSVLVIV